jgi:hypothetical protein
MRDGMPFGKAGHRHIRSPKRSRSDDENEENRGAMMITTPRVLGITLSLLAGAAGVRTVHASEFDAVAISSNIQHLHLPFGTILDPRFASSDPESPGYSDWGAEVLLDRQHVARSVLRRDVRFECGL